MNTKTLGILGLIGAPFLLIDSWNNGFHLNAGSHLSGMFNFLYITGWMCSMLALKKIGALGEGRFGKLLFVVQMSFLTLANCWNIYEWVQPGAGTRLYFILDTFWPLSNLCMFVTGITIAIKAQLQGWRRFMPLLVGCWLPIGLILWAIFSRTPTVLLILNVYSVVMWSLMAISIVTLRNQTGDDNRRHSLKQPRFSLEGAAS